MKKSILYSLTLMCIISAHKMYSQNANIKDTTKIFYYKGRIVDEQENPLVFAHVINKRRGQATITDSTGYFKLVVIHHDTLRISTIGYHTRIIPVDRIQNFDTSFHIIKMEKREYDIATVDIYELRWQVFKSEFMEKEIEEDKVAKNITNWMAHLVPVEELRMIYQSTKVPGFTINWKTKEDKARIKVAKLEKEYQLIAPKFNDQLINALTGLKGKEIYDFLRFCNFSESFLINASEYEIMEEILSYWNEYKKRGLHKKKSE